MTGSVLRSDLYFGIICISTLPPLVAIHNFIDFCHLEPIGQYIIVVYDIVPFVHISERQWGARGRGREGPNLWNIEHLPQVAGLFNGPYYLLTLLLDRNRDSIDLYHFVSIYEYTVLFREL